MSEIMESESNRPLGSVAMLPCAEHLGQEHRHEVVDDEARTGVGKLWRCFADEERVPTLPYEQDEPWMGYTPGEDADLAEHPQSERRAWARY